MEGLLLLLFLALLLADVIWTAMEMERNRALVWKKPLLFLIPSLLVFSLYMGYSPVDAGNVGVIVRMGAVVGTLPPGPHFVTPFVSHVDQVTIKTMTVNPDEDASSFDLQQVHTQVTLAYHFDETNITYIYSKLIDNSPNAVENKVIIPAILEAIKASTAKYNVQELVAKRSQVRDDIEAMVKARIAPYHIIAETTSITNFRFSKEYEESIEQKQVAQQAAEKASNVLQRIKIEADQKIAAAQGEATALKLQKEQITPELLQLRMIEMMSDKWDGALPQNYYGGQAPLPIVDAFKGSRNGK